MTMKVWRLCIMGLFTLLFGCSDDKPSVLPEVLSETEPGFIDMVFAVTKQEQMPTGEFAIEMAAIADGDEVVVRAILGRDWKKGTLGGQIPTFQGIVTVVRVDGRSDRFIKFMDKVYATGLTPGEMKDSVRFTGLSLEGNPTTPRKGPLKIKLFFESEDQNEYAEAYLNFDLINKKGWLKEKDPEYRSPLVGNLKKK